MLLIYSIHINNINLPSIVDADVSDNNVLANEIFSEVSQSVLTISMLGEIISSAFESK